MRMPPALLRMLPAALLVLAAAPGSAQRNETLVPHLRSLRVEAGADGNALPVLQLGSTDRLRISFDDMTHEYRRYTYRIEHLDPDFRPTEGLFESEYAYAAADEEVIEDYAESMNTVTNYTHYSFTFPNSRMRPLLSGNYRLVIRTEDEDDEPQDVAHIYFYVLDKKADVTLRFTTNTDVDWNAAHQQIGMQVNLGCLVVRDAQSEVRTVVLQNRRWDNAVVNPAPTHVNGQTLTWDHCRALIFPAGNEFRAFEMLTTGAPGMHMESIHWYEPYYHATLTPDLPARNYLRQDDRNGQFVIRNWDDNDNDTGSEYVWTHFTLALPRIPDTDIYLSGQWTDNRLAPEYRLGYNEEAQAYETAQFLKLGYYSYQYLAVPKGSSRGATAPTEGDFWQTENEYAALVYYRRTGDRYWQLVGETSPTFRP